MVSKRVMEALRKADFGEELDGEKEENTVTVAGLNVKRQTGNNPNFLQLINQCNNKLLNLYYVGKKDQKKHPVKRKKAVQVTIPPDGPMPSTSHTVQTPEVIWQKENDKQKLAENKLRAIELFKRSKGRGKRPALRQASSRAHLSESDSNSS